jgi:hypothetical protein
MNWGPLEFAEYLRRREQEQGIAATTRAARAAAPASVPVNQLRVVSGPRTCQSRPPPAAPQDPADR